MDCKTYIITIQHFKEYIDIVIELIKTLSTCKVA